LLFADHCGAGEPTHFDVPHRRLTEEAIVLAVDLTRTLIADFERRTRGIDPFIPEYFGTVLTLSADRLGSNIRCIMPSHTTRSEKLDLRLTRHAKRALQAAAAVAHRSVSEFVLESALARAEEALADRAVVWS